MQATVADIITAYCEQYQANFISDYNYAQVATARMERLQQA